MKKPVLKRRNSAGSEVSDSPASLRRGKTFWKYLLLYIILVLLPFGILAGFYYPASLQIIRNNQYHAGIRDAEQVKRYTDTQLSNILNLPSVLKNHQNLRQYDLEHNVLSRYNAKYELYNLIRMNSFIDVLYFYLRNTEQFIAPTGFGSFDLSRLRQSYSVYGTYFPDQEYEEFRITLNTLQENQIKIFQEAVIEGHRYERMIAFLMPLSSGKACYATVLVLVDSASFSDVSQQLHLENPRSLVYFDAHDQLISSDLSLSQADEAVLRNLKYSGSDTGEITLNAGRLFYTRSSSDYFGWTYLSLISAESIMGEIRQLNIRSGMIFLAVVLAAAVLIWFSMRKTYLPIYQLAQTSAQTVQQSSPADLPHLDELGTVSRAITELQSYNQQLNHTLGSIRPNLRDHVLYRILKTGSNDASSLSAWMNTLHRPFDPPFRAGLLVVDPKCETKKICDAVNALSNESVQLLAGADDREGMVDVLISGAADPKNIVTLLRENIRCGPLSFGESVEELKDIHLSYLQSLEVMDWLYLKNESDAWASYEQMPSNLQTAGRYPVELLHQLEGGLRNENPESIRSAAARLTEMIQSEALAPFFVRSIFNNTVSILLSEQSQQSDAQEESLLAMYSAVLQKKRTRDEMASLIRELTESWCTHLQERNHGLSSTTVRAVDCIAENLSNPELSLNYLADQLQLNPTTLSRIFKEEMGKGFKEYLDTLRIEEAKRLLAETRLSVEEITLRVGYDNSSSFSRRFRAMCGSSPTQYRSEHSAP